MHILFESVPTDPVYPKLSKLVRVCWSYSLPKLARLDTQYRSHQKVDHCRATKA